MTTRFAGSSSIDERRRRRLASDADAEPTEASRDELHDAEESAVDTDAEPAVPPCAWIPRKAWQAWLLFAGAALLVAGLFHVGRAVDRAPDFYGPELSGLLGLESGRLLHTTGSLLLLLAGQLSLVIWSARTRSTRDFSGRYDVWVWTAGAWFLFALVHETEAHRAWSEVATLVWEPDFWNKTILSWFAPAIAAGGVLWMSARADARRNVSARVLMSLAPLMWIGSGLLALGVGSRWLAPWQTLLVEATALAGHVAGFGAMLLHARYVTFVCNDPPEESRSRRSFDEFEMEDDEDAIESSNESEPRAEQPEPEKKAPSKKPARTRRKPEPEPTPEPIEVAAEEPEPEVETPVEPSFNDGTEEDGPPPEMLRGLSKRQKKRVRREWRERQRELADAA